MTPAAVIWGLTSFALMIYIIWGKMIKRKKKIHIGEGSYQIAVVINKDLKMSSGKVLSQFGHAIDGITEALEDYPELKEIWKNSGSAKIVLKGTQDDVNQVYYNAKELGLLYYRVFDAGKTQIKTGSNTCIAVGPATKEQLGPITGMLSLY